MTNHVHLLMTPERADGISSVMQSIGRRYVQYVNYAYKRSGTLWEGRHKSSLVSVEQYLLKCYRYIEMNPVRAGMVEHPADYKWSSYRTNAYGERCQFVTPHSLYMALGSQPADRLEAYRELFILELNKQDVHDIRKAAQFSIPLGDNRFKDEIERVLNVKVGHARRGRPVVEEEVAIYYI